MKPQDAEKSFLALFFAAELRAWRGQMPLPPVFWGYGVGTSLALIALTATALVAGELVFQQILLLLSLAYTIWVLVAIWRCAPNAALVWATAARLAVVAWGLNAAFVLLFLQIELVVRFARG